MAEQAVTAYCVKCREKREIKNPQAVYTEAGRAATKGTCPVCGSVMFRMGRTPAHDKVPAPGKGKASSRPSKK